MLGAGVREGGNVVRAALADGAFVGVWWCACCWLLIECAVAIVGAIKRRRLSAAFGQTGVHGE
jgi:hypothetical protein